MMTRDTAKDMVTMYNHLSLVDGKCTYVRTVIPDCVWEQDSEAAFQRTGTANPEAVRLLISFDSRYRSVQNGEEYDGYGWTVAMGPELLGSYIVKGECRFLFPLEEDAESMSKEEFFKEFVQPFERDVKYKRPREIIERFTGSRNMWYVEVRC